VITLPPIARALAAATGAEFSLSGWLESVQHALDLDCVPWLASPGRMPVFGETFGDHQESEALTSEFLHILS
jgi:hypothetical protein